jgi:hypothetical protein
MSEHISKCQSAFKKNIYIYIYISDDLRILVRIYLVQMFFKAYVHTQFIWIVELESCGIFQASEYVKNWHAKMSEYNSKCLSEIF